MLRPRPRTAQELNDLIVERIVFGQLDLNDIDISLVTDMSQMFWQLNFQGDISQWDVAHVTSMEGMFEKSTFNGDIAGWNVGRVTNMEKMFLNSEFQGDLSRWDVGRVTTMRHMFQYSMFNGNLSQWDVRRVEDFRDMFNDCPYTQDLGAWTPCSAKNMVGILWNDQSHDIHAWRVPADCEANYVMKPTTMVSFDKPSFYHFFLLYTEQMDFVGQGSKAFVEHHRSLLQGMGLSPMQAAVWLHAAWYDGPQKEPPILNYEFNVLS